MHLIVISLLFVFAASAPLQAGELKLPPETHPSLLFESETIALLQERIERSPYDGWWTGILNTANGALNVDFHTLDNEQTRSVYAEALALAGLVSGDENFLAKAGEALETVNPFANWGQGHVEGKSALSIALAYDWLAGSGYLDERPDLDNTIREILAVQADKMLLNPILPFMLNNWKIRYYAGMGMLALAIRDEKSGIFSPSFIFQMAELRVLPTIEYQAAVEDTGSIRAYAEGLDYLVYSQDCYIPYFAAVKNLTGYDHFADDAVHGIHLWQRALRMPWGETPNFDDASLDLVPGGILANFYPDEAEIWRWAGMVNGVDDVNSILREEALIFFDDTIIPEAPAGKAATFLPVSGQAIFRNDWSEDGIYLLLLGEHGPPRIRGGGHEHPDPTSFILAAGGEILAVDGGYISWYERKKVNGPENHNLILVDGKGPSRYLGVFPFTGGADSYLTAWSDSAGTMQATVRTNYEDADIVRRVFFEEGEYFVIVDRIVSRNGSPRRFDLLVHGNGYSGDGTFELTANGGTWTIGEMTLDCEILASRPCFLREETSIHSFYYGQELTHSVLVGASGGMDVTFVTFLTPGNSETLYGVSERDVSFQNRGKTVLIGDRTVDFEF